METDEVLALLRDVAEQVIDPRFRSLDADEIAEKNPGDLVTVADREAEELITAALRGAYPDAVVLGEEAASQDPSELDRFGAAGHAFAVDPLDGTKNFVQGSPDHAVMVAEVRGGATVRGWIWLPQHRTAYVAELGAGAYRDGARLGRPPADPPLRGVTSRRRWVGRTLGALEPLELTWVSCGVDYPRLCEGAADYAVYGRAMPWDHAAGSLLLTEAGGYVGTVTGHAYLPQSGIPDGLVAAGDRPTYDLVHDLLDAPSRRVGDAQPGLAPPEPVTDPRTLELVVDGERFVLAPHPPGGTTYDWRSGPNRGYGFGSTVPFDSSEGSHREQIRDFLGMIDPETGYVSDDDG